MSQGPASEHSQAYQVVKRNYKAAGCGLVLASSTNTSRARRVDVESRGPYLARRIAKHEEEGGCRIDLFPEPKRA